MYCHVNVKDVYWGTKERMVSWLKLINITISAIAVSQGALPFASSWLMSYVFCDIADGILAPLSPGWTDNDERSRRLLDSASDVLIPLFYAPYAIYSVGMSLTWCVPYIIREALIVMLAKNALAKKQAIVFPNSIHKSAKLVFALAGVCVLNNWYAAYALSVAYLLLFGTLMDYLLLFLAEHPEIPQTTSGYRFVRPKNFGGFLSFFSPKKALGHIREPLLLLEKNPRNL